MLYRKEKGLSFILFNVLKLNNTIIQRWCGGDKIKKERNKW